MKLKKSKIFTNFLIFILCLITFLTGLLSSIIFSFNSNYFVYASADVKKYSSVMDDLSKDKAFSIANYPSYTLDYINKINNDELTNNDQEFLEVVQIAESSSNELYIYVYRPTVMELKLNATSISMSTEYSKDGQNLDLTVYDLELVSESSVFAKYVVKNFTVSQEPERFYNIVTLYRIFNSTIDELSSGSVTENYEVGMSVGQAWCVYYQNDTLVYEMGTFETLEINVNYTGNFEFSSGIKFGNLLGVFDCGHSWFIAFDLENYIAERIIDADLIYKKRSVVRTSYVGKEASYSFGDFSEDIEVKLSEKDTASYDGGGWFSKRYTWNRISTGEDFLKNAEDQDINVSADCFTKLKESQWVFAFTETEYTYISEPIVDVGSGSSSIGSITGNAYYTDIADVTILRIHFIDDRGVEYNLGVVSDRTNPDNISDGFGGLGGWDDFWSEDAVGKDCADYLNGNDIEKLIGLVLGLLVIFLVIYLFDKLGILSFIGKGIIWIIMLPINLIKWIIGLFRGGGNE